MSNSEDLKKQAKNLPQRPGIYQYKDSLKQILYVGKALSLKDRVLFYFQKDISPKTQKLLDNSKTIDYIETESEFSALLLEAKLIKTCQPKYNFILKDDKSYLYIFMSLGEEYPKIFAVRKLQPKADCPLVKKWDIWENLKGTYFGPFPSSKNTYELLKWLRRIIPYCQQKHIQKKACFYKHLGLCNPCPSDIVKQLEKEKIRLKKIYRKNIFRIKNLLEGNFKKVKKDLNREMKQLSINCRFEEAAVIRNRIGFLDYLLIRNMTEKYLENANFFINKQQTALSELRHLLEENGFHFIKLFNIEGFDVSNIFGKYAVASSVAFINGLPDKKYYRKYLIKAVAKPNDVGMLKEAVIRRLKHHEWPYPDLILVDGGKPQVKTIFDLLKEKEINIPVIGLVKKEETIIFFNNNIFSEIKINKSNPSLQFLQYIRDEAHRFAVNYHRHLRSAFLTEID